jgi:hypothetical protein
MTVQELWPDALRAFNERNMSRTMDLEIIESDLGAQAEARGLHFNGAAFDHRGGDVEIMLSGRPGYHITHRIPNVTSIDTLTATLAAQDVLRVTYEGGQTILRSSDPSRACCDVCANVRL